MCCNKKRFYKIDVERRIIFWAFLVENFWRKWYGGGENYKNMNKISSNKPDRKRNRLRYFDYSQNGYYFITIYVKNKQEYFGNVKKNKMIFNKCGQIVKNCWLEIPKHFPHAILDEYIVMPNHVHGIITIDNENNQNDAGNGNKFSDLIVGNKDFCSLHIHSPHPWQTKLSRSLSRFQNRCNQMVQK